jgi:hypothetical protein
LAEVDLYAKVHLGKFLACGGKCLAERQKGLRPCEYCAVDLFD